MTDRFPLPLIQTTRRVTFEELVLRKIQIEWPNAEVTGPSDVNEQLIWRDSRAESCSVEQNLSAQLAEQDQRQVRDLNQSQKADLDRYPKEAQMALEAHVDADVEPLPEVETFESDSGSGIAHTAPFHRRRVGFALLNLLLCLAVGFNCLIFPPLVGNLTHIVQTALWTLALMALGFLVGRNLQPLLPGTFREKGIALLSGVTMIVVLGVFILAFSELELASKAGAMEAGETPATLTFVPSFFPAISIETRLFVGACFGLLVLGLGLGSGPVDPMGLRARLRVIQAKMKRMEYLRERQVRKPDAWLSRRKKALNSIQKAIRSKEHALQKAEQEIEKIEKAYWGSTHEYRQKLASWTGTSLPQGLPIVLLWEKRPDFTAVQKGIERDRNRFESLRQEMDVLSRQAMEDRRKIFDLFEAEIKRLRRLAELDGTRNNSASASVPRQPFAEMEESKVPKISESKSELVKKPSEQRFDHYTH